MFLISKCRSKKQQRYHKSTSTYEKLPKVNINKKLTTRDIEQKIYDVCIVGGGVAGLVCGSLLSQAGKSVIILEQNDVIGGGLHVFRKGKFVFETGTHYIGNDKDVL